MDFQPKNILVTGAAGFIGSNYVRWVLKNNPTMDKVISLDKLTYAGDLNNLKSLNHPEKHQFIKGDICDKQLIAEVFEQHQINTVVHFAAESHVDNSILTPEIFLQTNIIGTFNLLEQSRLTWLESKKLNPTQCRFHHISTDEVYGSLERNAPAFTEDHVYQPNSPYSASKASSDHIARAYIHTYQLPITISNCSNNYGPYQHAEKLIPVVIKKCLAKEPIPIYGDGSNIRDWLFVEDHCEAIDLILRKGSIGESYNIGGNQEIDNLNLVKSICSLMDEYKPSHAPHERYIQFVEDRKGHDWRYAINAEKIKQKLGWEPSNNFKALLKKTIEYYL